MYSLIIYINIYYNVDSTGLLRNYRCFEELETPRKQLHADGI